MNCHSRHSKVANSNLGITQPNVGPLLHRESQTTGTSNPRLRTPRSRERYEQTDPDLRIEGLRMPPFTSISGGLTGRREPSGDLKTHLSESLYQVGGLRRWFWLFVRILQWARSRRRWCYHQDGLQRGCSLSIVSFSLFSFDFLFPFSIFLFPFSFFLFSFSFIVVISHRLRGGMLNKLNTDKRTPLWLRELVRGTIRLIRISFRCPARGSGFVPWLYRPHVAEYK